MRSLRFQILLLALAGAGCTCQEPAAPIVTAVEPAEAPNDGDTALVVRGAHFLPAVKADLDHPGRSWVDAAFALELVGPNAERVALAGATLVSEGEIQAALPAGASPGTYDLQLVDPRGRAAALAAAVLVYVPDCTGDGAPCDDGNPCTVRDVCQGRLCRPGTPVACQALDACHIAGTCDPGTGLCSNPPAPDGTGCTDGDLCTQVDACQGGACVGSSPVACTATDACHLAGACDPGTGLCSNPPAPDGSGCTDGDLCTQVDACQGGACLGSSPVACGATDACHLAGACDPGTGLCSNPPAPDGTGCTDGDLCTQVDACQGGTCVGSSPVSCTPQDACHLAGACDPGTGLCSNPAAPDGTGCDDGNLCTQVDACQGGACLGSSPVACTAVDACHVAGACDPGTGLCSNPPAPDGTGCDDGSLCTEVDVCQGGACLGSSPVACAALDACHPGVCDPATGLCSNPAAPDGTPCQSACAAGETCQAEICTQPPGGCVNTAPLARLSVTPQAGPVLGPVTFDASASSDAEDPTASLTAEFDFEGGGVFTSPQPATSTTTYAYPMPGVYQASVRVTDPGGMTAYATVLVVAFDSAAEVRVTTAADENDKDATPTNPQGTGLSLREAVTYVNFVAAPLVITFAFPMSVVMTGGQRDLTLTAPGTVLAGAPGVSVDFAGFNQACLVLDAPNQLLLGLTLTGCDATFVNLSPRSQGSQVAHCSIGPGATAVGVSGQADSGPAPLPPPASLIGPGNDLFGLDTGVRLTGTDYAVEGNRIHGGNFGVVVTGVRARLIMNRVYANAGTGGPNVGVGLAVSQGPGPVSVLHDLFDGNALSGIAADSIPMQVRNTLFTNSAGYGIYAPAGNFAPGDLGPNGFFGNGLGPVSAELSIGPGDVLADPLYANRPAGDFRLLPGSPAVNAGALLSVDGIPLDVNGPATGTYNSLAPDLGPEETPYGP